MEGTNSYLILGAVVLIFYGIVGFVLMVGVTLRKGPNFASPNLPFPLRLQQSSDKDRLNALNKRRKGDKAD